MSAKKPVSSSNLALRFYKCHGWTREDLEPYLLKGVIQDTEEVNLSSPLIRVAVPSRRRNRIQ